MKKFVFSLVLAASVLATGAFAKNTLKVYEGPWGDVQEADLAVHPLKDENYTESWFLMVQGEGDLWLFVHYGISNLQPLSDFDGVIETTVLHQGKPVFVKDNIEKKLVKFTPGKMDLTLGKSTLKAAPGGYALKVVQEDVSLDLTVKPQVGGVKPSKTVYPGGEYYELHLAAPRAEVSGMLDLDGKKIAVKGVGYLDHSVQNFPAHKMADRLYSFRGFSDSDGVNLLTFATPKDIGGVDMPALVLMKDNQVLSRSTTVRIEGSKPTKDKDNDYTYPTVWTIQAKDGDAAVTGKITLDKRVHMQNAADDFNLFERTLIKTFVANPMLYRHTGTFEFTAGGKTVKGTGIAEVVILRE